MRNIRRRLEVLELLADASEMAPDRIRAAMRNYRERGELPTTARLREYVVDLFGCLAVMRASVPGWIGRAPRTCKD